MGTKRTSGNKPLQERELTTAQQSAVDLLVSGKNDREAAELLGLNRVTVTRWRLYAPEFIAALNQRRAEVWGQSVDKIRSLLPKALDVLAEMLDPTADPPTRLKAVAEVLKLAPMPPDAMQIGPQQARMVVRDMLGSEQRDEHSIGYFVQGEDGSIIAHADLVEEKWRQLQAQATGD